MRTCGTDSENSTEPKARTESRIRQLIASHKPYGPLARPFYTDPAIFDIDLERVFMNRWLFVGHISRVPQPGDYFTYEIGNESIIVVRGKDQGINALFNVCRHRGSRICLEPSGHVNNSLVCPYHQWVYKTDGSLAAARLMPKDFDKSKYGLHRAQARVLEGLIFISLSENPPDFNQTIGDEIQSALMPYELANAKICVTKHFNVRANWKLIAENLRECYHCAYTHPEYCNTVVGASTLESPKAAAEFDAYLKECKEKWKALGWPDVDGPLRKEIVQARYPLRKGYQSESLDGRPLAPLMGKLTRDGSIYGMVVVPSLYLEATCDYAYTVRMTPVSTSLTHFEIDWYVRHDAREGVDYDVDQIIKVADATWSQDFRLCENNQLGVNSSRYEPGPYAPAELYSFEYGAIQEVGVCEQMINWYLSDLQSNTAA